MNIAFPATGADLKDVMDDRFGRAKGFLVVDADTMSTTYLDNTTNVDAGGGAGTGAAQKLAEAGVEMVVCREVGPKADAVLSAAGIRVVTCPRDLTVEQAHDQLQRGLLREQTA